MAHDPPGADARHPRTTSGAEAGPRLLRRAGLAPLLALLACSGVPVMPSEPPSAEPPATPPTPSTPPTPPTPAASTSSQPSGAWELVWADEFDDPAGTPPAAERWVHAIGDGTAEGIPGWGNQELETYTDDPANASTDGNGNLVIRALAADVSIACWYGDCRFTSARLLTRDRFSVVYGRIEARIRVAAGSGLWSAFWMLGTDIDRVGWPASGEIDVMEHVGRKPNTLWGTVHGPGYSGSSGRGATIDLDSPLSDDFHVFAIEWEPERIVWLLDGEPYHELRAADLAPERWVFDHESFLLLNLAVGGGLGGPVFPDTVFPAEMLVDHVRVYQRS